MILYIENPKVSTPKKKWINEFSKLVGYKINIKKSAISLYANNELSEKEFKKITPVMTASKRIK